MPRPGGDLFLSLGSPKRNAAARIQPLGTSMIQANTVFSESRMLLACKRPAFTASKLSSSCAGIGSRFHQGSLKIGESTRQHFRTLNNECSRGLIMASLFSGTCGVEDFWNFQNSVLPMLIKNLGSTSVIPPTGLYHNFSKYALILICIVALNYE